jgi:hypothetical protein
MELQRLPIHSACTTPPSFGPLNRTLTVRLSSWILGLAFIALPRLAQAQDLASGTAIYGTGQAGPDWTGGTISSGATLRLDDGGTVSGDATNNGCRLALPRRRLGAPSKHWLLTGKCFAGFPWFRACAFSI